MAQVQRTLLDLLGTARFFIGTVAIVAVAIAVPRRDEYHANRGLLNGLGRSA